MHSLDYLMSEIQMKLASVRRATERNSNSFAAVKASTEEVQSSMKRSFEGRIREMQVRHGLLMKEVDAAQQQQVSMLSQRADALAHIRRQLEECFVNNDQLRDIIVTEEQRAALRDKISDALQLTNHINLDADHMHGNLIRFVEDPAPLCAAIQNFGAVVAGSGRRLVDLRNEDDDQSVAMSEDDIEVIPYGMEFNGVAGISLDGDSEDGFIRIGNYEDACDKLESLSIALDQPRVMKDHTKSTTTGHSEEDEMLQWLASSNKKALQEPLQEPLQKPLQKPLQEPLQQLAEEAHNLTKWLYNNNPHYCEKAVTDKSSSKEDATSIWLAGSLPAKTDTIRATEPLLLETEPSLLETEPSLLEGWLASQCKDKPGEDDTPQANTWNTWIATRTVPTESKCTIEEAYTSTMGQDERESQNEEQYLDTGASDQSNFEVTRVLAHLDEIQNEAINAYLVRDSRETERKPDVPAYCDWLTSRDGDFRCDDCPGGCWVDTEKTDGVWRVTASDW